MSEPLGEALNREVVVWSPKLEVDWGRDGYGAGGTIDDLTDRQERVQVTHSEFDGLPEGVSFVNQSGVPTLIAQVGGTPEMNATRYFSPFRTDSPLFGIERDGAPTRFEQGPVTDEGPERVRLFTGQVLDLHNPPGTAAQIQAVSSTRMALAQSVQPPPLVAGTYGWGSTEELLTATWLVSWILHRCGVYPSPPAVPGCIRWFPFHGGYHSFLQFYAIDLQEPIALSGEPDLANGSFWSTPEQAWRQALPRWVRGPYVAGLVGYVTDDAIRWVRFVYNDSEFQVPSISSKETYGEESPKVFRAGESAGRVQFYLRGDEVDWSGVPAEAIADENNPLPGNYFTSHTVMALVGVPDDVVAWGVTYTNRNTNGLVLPSGSGHYASTPDAAALDASTELDIFVDITPDDWTPSGNQYIVSKFAVTGNQRSWALRLATDGTLQLWWSPDGTSETNATSGSPVPFANGERGAIRVSFNGNESGQTVVRFWTAPNFNTSFTLLGTDITGGTSSLNNSTTPVTVGGRDLSTSQGFQGTVHRLQVYDTVTLFNEDAIIDAIFEREEPGTTSFTDEVGNVWTLNGSAEISEDTFASMAWWIDEDDRKVRLRFWDGATNHELESTNALPADGQWHFLGLAWSIEESRLAINLDGQVDLYTDPISDAGLLGPWTPTTEFEDATFVTGDVTAYVPLSEAQVSSGLANADPILNPIWMRDMQWERKAHIYPSSLNISTISYNDPREAYEALQDIAQTELAHITIDGDDVFHYRPLGFYAASDQQAITETITTDRHAQTPDVRLDSTRLRNVVVASYNRVRLDAEEAPLKWYTVLEIPPGVTTYRIPYTYQPVVVPFYGEVVDLLTSTDITFLESGVATLLGSYSRFVSVNTASDGSGTLITDTDQVSVTIAASYAGAFELQFTNKLAETLYTANQGVAANGEAVPYIFIGFDPVVPTQETIIESYDSSVEARGARSLAARLSHGLVGTETEARQMTRRILGATAKPVVVIDRLALFGDPRREPGALVQVQDPVETGVDEQFRLGEVVHNVTDGGAEYTQTARMQQARPVGRWGSSRWGECLWAGREDPGIYEG